MLVKELIEKLKGFPEDLEVLISDGYDYNFYRGEYKFGIFYDADNTPFMDISVGGLKED